MSAVTGSPADAADPSSGPVEGDASSPSVAVRLVVWYQRTFAGGAPTCRFYPSCSSYSREALEVHGTWRGLWLTARRLLRCRPFGPSGVDPVPPPRVGAPPSDDLIVPADHHDRDDAGATVAGHDRTQPSRKAS